MSIRGRICSHVPQDQQPRESSPLSAEALPEVARRRLCRSGKQVLPVRLRCRMKLEDLFPEAPQPCRFCARTDPHKHVLDHQRRLIESDAKYIAILGGYGSAKTLGIAALGVGLSLAVPGNAGIVCRRSYAKLHDSTERIFLETLQRAGTEFKARELRDGWPHRIILPNASEIVFRETKDLGRFLGPEYGWFVVDEAVEEPRKTFTDLTGRLRLGRAQHFLKGVIASNPPNIHHWIPDVFGRTPGRRS